VFADWVRGAPNQRTNKFNHIRVKLSRSMSEFLDYCLIINLNTKNDYLFPISMQECEDLYQKIHFIDELL